MDKATDTDAVSAFVEQVVDGTGWIVDRVRRRDDRLEPPDWFWTTFAVDIHRDGKDRSLRLVAKGALSTAAWEKLAERLSDGWGGLPCDPINGIGYPRLFPETQHAYWFYPFDPRMPNLPQAADPAWMAPILVGLDQESAMHSAWVERLRIERVRYNPEVGAILCYTMEPAGIPIKIYGKVQPGHRGLRTFRLVEGLWRAAERYPGYLNLPRPLAYVDELGLLLEEGVRGRPVTGHRNSGEFMGMGIAAAEALAVIHESQLESDEQIEIEDELGRLDRVVEQFAYVAPGGHFLLRDLVTHMRERVAKTQEEDVLPTHGDMKYDQFVFHNDRYTLLDFDYFATAETSYDVGKFCAYAIPTWPRSWEDSAAAEEVRELFLRRYRELRPHATLQRFGVYEALHLALRAMTAMGMQMRDWERISETFLVMAFERLKSRLPA